MKLADRGHLQEMSRPECLARLATVSVGRLGVTMHALPAIIPVNFRVHDGGIVFRSVPGTKLEAATTDAVVAFEADDHAPDGSWGWSVLVQGVAWEVTDPTVLADLRALHLEAWAFPAGEAHRYLRIETEVVHGRRFDRSQAFRH